MFSFFFNDTATTEIYTLSLHDALPIWDYSGGIATDLFVHLCTTIHFLMDAKVPSRAMAMGELYRWKKSRNVPDTLNAILEYPEGFVVNLSSTFNNQVSAEGSFQILGTEGSIILGSDMSFVPEHPVEDNRWIVESWPEALEKAYYKDPKVRQAEMPSTRRPKVLDGSRHFSQEGPNSTILHVGHFLDSVRTRKPYWEDAERGHHAATCAAVAGGLTAENRSSSTPVNRMRLN